MFSFNNTLNGIEKDIGSGSISSSKLSRKKMSKNVHESDHNLQRITFLKETQYQMALYQNEMAK